MVSGAVGTRFGEDVLRAFVGLALDGRAAGEFVAIPGAVAGLVVDSAAGEVVLGTFAGLAVDGASAACRSETNAVVSVVGLAVGTSLVAVLGGFVGFAVGR